MHRALYQCRVYDGRDMLDLLLDTTGTVQSKHEFLFMYGGCKVQNNSGLVWHNKVIPGAVRYGRYKAYWCTGPGLGGCSLPSCKTVQYVPLSLAFPASEGVHIPPEPHSLVHKMALI